MIIQWTFTKWKECTEFDWIYYIDRNQSKSFTLISYPSLLYSVDIER